VASNVLWEFNQSTINNCPSTVCHGSTATIGYSFGQPVVTKTAKYGWVVILSSGYDNADGIGYLFLVNPKTGALLEAPLSTGVGSAGTPSGLAQFTTFVPNYSDGTSDSIYAADLLGNVWRVDLTTTTGSYAAPMLLATADDPSGNPQPITVYPQAEVAQGTLKRYVVFGTGKTLSSTDMSNSQINTIYSIWDGTGTSGGFLTSATLPNGITYPIKRSELQVVTDLTVGLPSTLTGGPMGWYIDLAAATGGYSAEQIDVQPAVDLGVAMFGINVSGGAVCDPNGTGRVDEFNIGTAMSEIVGTSGSVVGTFQASSRIISVDFVNIGGSDITGVFSMDGGGSSKTEIIGNGGGTYGNNGSIIKSLSFSNSPTSLNWREIKGAN
jgi:type IV pilus assembly protein PilY1